MGLSIGHRGGVKPRRRGNGLSKIKRRHGIPFYNPAETYEKHDFLLADAVKIFFTAKGSIHNGTPTVKGVLKGASSIIFDPKGELSRVTAPSAESQRMQGKTTIHFFQSATISKHHKMQGVSWIVFALKMLVHRIKGESDIVFSTSATLSGYKLRGFASITFSAIINNVKLVKYGLLYNWYAITDVRKITSSDDWGVSDHLEFKTLSDYLGGNAAAGGKLKETGFTYWDSPNSGATNEVGLNVKGGGYRKYDDGTFQGLRATFRFWNNGELAGAGRTSWINYDDTTFWTYDGITSYINNKKMGAYIRLFRPATAAEQLLPDGTACDNYVGNDLKEYPTVKIGTQVWLACNLAETKFRNGEDIPIVTDNAAWAALTTAGMCAYKNDHTNVFI